MTATGDTKVSHVEVIWFASRSVLEHGAAQALFSKFSHFLLIRAGRYALRITI